VICGLAIAQYEHIDPPFAEARSHDPKRIALLCGACHDRVTRGFWSKDRVLKARKSPKTFKDSFARDAFDLKSPFDLLLGDNHIQNVRCIIRKSTGDEWFTIDPPEAPDAPPRISAKFFGSHETPELEIINNEWRCSTGVWDLKISGPEIEVRSGHRNVVLRLMSHPPHCLEIKYLRMFFKDTGIVVKPDGTVRLSIDGTEIFMNSSSVTSADAVFSLP
jgi:hypothetical protein